MKDVINAIKKAIEAFDLDDKIGNDIDKRHKMEEEAVSLLYSALAVVSKKSPPKQQNHMLTNEEIVDFLMEPDYREYVRDMLLGVFQSQTHRRISWDAWFRGANGDDLVNADKGIVYFPKIAKNLDELETFIMSDQPTTCPKCGSRTDSFDIDKEKQQHLCLNDSCNFEFFKEEE